MMFLADFQFPVGFFDFTYEHKTEIAIVRDYKDKPRINWFIVCFLR